MTLPLRDAALPLFLTTVLAPVAIACFEFGIPIEVIVFGLLLASYKGPHWLKSWKRFASFEPHRDHGESVPDEPDSHGTTSSQDDSKTKFAKQTKTEGSSWRSNLSYASWRSKATDESRKGYDAGDTLSWRSRASGDSKNRKGKAVEPPRKPDNKN